MRPSRMVERFRPIEAKMATALAPCLSLSVQRAEPEQEPLHDLNQANREIQSTTLTGSR